MFELEPSASMYYRLDILIKYSKVFKDEVFKQSKILYEKHPELHPDYMPPEADINNVNSNKDFDKISKEANNFATSKMNRNYDYVVKASEEAEKDLMHITIGIAKQFPIYTSDDELVMLSGFLHYLIRYTQLDLFFPTENNNFNPSHSVKAEILLPENAEESQDISINIRAPLTKNEFIKLWDDFNSVQERFIKWWFSGFDMNSAEYIKNILTLYANTGKKTKESTRFKELLQGFYKWEVKLGSREYIEYTGLRKKITQSKTLFYDAPKQYIDEDLEILEISKEYPNIKEWQKYYELITLLKYLMKEKLLDFKIEDIEKISTSEFSELSAKYLPKYNHLGTEGIKKRVWIRNYKQRLEEIKKTLYMV